MVEVSHPEYRGVLTGSQSAMTSFGGLIAAISTFLTVNITGNAAWLILTCVQLICPALACVIIYLLPESPRYLYTHNQQQKVTDFLVKYHGEGDLENPYVKLEIGEFEEQLDLDGSDKKWWDYRVLFRTISLSYRLANSLIMGVWGALTNGGISYFVGAFFETAGITDAYVVLEYIVWQSVMCALLSFFGSPLCDLLGRRMLLIPTSIGVGVSWMSVAVATAMVEKDITNAAAAKVGIALYFIFSFIYCVGITPLQGMYAVEVFSYEQRAEGVEFSIFVVNAVSLTSLVLLLLWQI